MEDRGALTTEHSNVRTLRLHRLSVGQAFDLMNTEDATVAGAVRAARSDICRAIELVVDGLRGGGRLFYVGAGTSGRLGVLDATECPPTFLTDPQQLQGIIAGGVEALTCSVKGAEDRPEGGAQALRDQGVEALDVVFAIATGGTTPFVHGALEEARRCGAKTVFLACVPKDQVADVADVSIRVLTGPEVLTGSTRLKAGTATKMVLNMVSTISMIQLGKVYRNLMVDVKTSSNRKLVDRGIRVIRAVTGLSREQAGDLLERASGLVKVAILMHERGLDPQGAKQLLDESQGHLAPWILEDQRLETGN